MPEKPDDDHYFRGPYTDYFIKSSLFAYYTGENGVCEAIEFCQPTTGMFQGKPLNRVPFIEAMNWLKNFDYNLKVEEFIGVKSFKLGIGLYAPNYFMKEDPEESVEAVIVFRKGLYDGLF